MNKPTLIILLVLLSSYTGILISSYSYNIITENNRELSYYIDSSSNKIDTVIEYTNDIRNNKKKIMWYEISRDSYIKLDELCYVLTDKALYKTSYNSKIDTHTNVVKLKDSDLEIYDSILEEVKKYRKQELIGKCKIYIEGTEYSIDYNSINWIISDRLYKIGND